MGTAIAERATCRIDALEMGMARGNLLSVVESIQTTNHRQAVIDGRRCGLGLLVQLIPNIVQQRGLGDGGKDLRLALKPASEVQQVISVGAQRARRPSTNVLGIKKIVDPSDGVALLSRASDRGKCQPGREIDKPRSVS